MVLSQTAVVIYIQLDKWICKNNPDDFILELKNVKDNTIDYSEVIRNKIK